MGLNSRGAGGGGDIPSLDLQFATDKTLTARKGPTPVFTRASTATFVGSNGLIQSAAINTARFDHDPITLACKGLLIEESRTNLVFPSATLTTQTRTVTAVAHTLSFYGTGTVVLSGVATATVTGTGAYPTRTTLTFTPTAGSLVMTVTGSVTQAQLEAGAFPTSYIPTTTASVVRSADICSISGSDFTGIWNGVDATMFFRGSKIAQQSGQTSWSLSSNTNATALNLIRGSSTEILTAAGIAAISATTSLEYKVAAALKNADFAASFNGATVLTSNTVFVLTLNKLQIGTNYPSNGQLNGWIHSIKFYKKRLANAKLVTLTA